MAVTEPAVTATVTRNAANAAQVATKNANEVISNPCFESGFGLTSTHSGVLQAIKNHHKIFRMHHLPFLDELTTGEVTMLSHLRLGAHGIVLVGEKLMVG